MRGCSLLLKPITAKARPGRPGIRFRGMTPEMDICGRSWTACTGLKIPRFGTRTSSDNAIDPSGEFDT
jgi:hypothetical protein